MIINFVHCFVYVLVLFVCLFVWLVFFEGGGEGLFSAYTVWS